MIKLLSLYLILGVLNALLDYIDAKLTRINPGWKIQIICFVLITIFWPFYLVLSILVLIYQLIKKVF
jgi:hypothetical protein|nr:MAG TPA: toxin [Caudoviricetes sp.]